MIDEDTSFDFKIISFEIFNVQRFEMIHIQDVPFWGVKNCL